MKEKAQNKTQRYRALLQYFKMGFALKCETRAMMKTGAEDVARN